MKGAPNFSADPVVTICARNVRYWHLCECGAWRGRNSRFGCFHCGRLIRATKAEQAASIAEHERWRARAGSMWP